MVRGRPLNNIPYLGLAAILLCGMLIMRLQLVYGHKRTSATRSLSPCLWCQQYPEQDNDGEVHQSPKALEALKAYLQQYGYLEADRGSTSPLLQEMGDAIGMLQRSMGLPETKYLDAITYAAVREPRCGHPDYVHSRRHLKPLREVATAKVANAALLRPKVDDSRTTTAPPNRGNLVNERDSVVATEFAYFSGNPRWNSRLNLTWAISTLLVTSRLSRDDVRSAFLHAFQLWTTTVPLLRFREVQDYEAADVKISFVAGEHGDEQNFDGVLGIIAHAFSPEDGRVHFDDAEFWSVDVRSDKAPQALDLTSVAIHEVGHVIGLAHSPVRKSVMFPSIAPRHTKRDLSEDDVQGVRHLYGLDLLPSPCPLLLGNRASSVNLNWAFLIFLLFLNLMILISEHMLHQVQMKG